MKVFVAPSGDLTISQKTFSLIIFFAIGGALAVAASSGLVWFYFHPELLTHPLSLAEAALAVGVGLLGAGFLYVALAVVPLRNELICSLLTVTVIEQMICRCNRVTYLLNSVDYFAFTYFWPYKEWRRWGRIEIFLRTGELKPALTLRSVSKCRTAHQAMKAYFTDLGRDSVVGELPW